MFGGERREAGPAAAELQHAHPGARADLAAHEIQLGVLRGVQVGGARAVEVRARVHHARAEHRPIQVVADVIVTLADLERARRLAVEQLRAHGLRHQHPALAQGRRQVGAHDLVDHLVQRVAVPPAIDEALAHAQRAVAQHALEQAIVGDLDVPGGVAADRDAGAGQRFGDHVGRAALVHRGHQSARAGDHDALRLAARRSSQLFGARQRDVDGAWRGQPRAREHPGEAVHQHALPEPRRVRAQARRRRRRCIAARAVRAPRAHAQARDGAPDAGEAAVVGDHGVRVHARRVARRIARQDRLRREAAGDDRGQDPLGGQRLRQTQAVPDQQRAAGAVGVDARSAVEMRGVEQVIRVSLHRGGLQLGHVRRRNVAAGDEVLARAQPGGAHLVRVDGPRADVRPVSLGDVPRIAAQIVVQKQLGLTVTPDTGARDRVGIGAELVLLHADRSARARRREQARHRAVRAAGADQVRRPQPGDGPVAPLAVVVRVP